MIKKTSILYGVTKPLSDNFVGIPVYCLDKVETIESNAFYINIITVSRESEANNYITKRFTIDIMYKAKRKDNPEIYMDTEDKILDEIFINFLTITSLDAEVRDRKPRITSQISNVTDNVLHCMFDIEFIDKYDPEDNTELMGDLRVKFKLVNEVINPSIKSNLKWSEILSDTWEKILNLKWGDLFKF